MKRFTLLEHVEVDGARYIGTRNGFDLFQMLTWDACQEFACATNLERAAGTQWVHDEDTFDNNINDTVRLYFFTEEDTSAVVLGALSGNNTREGRYQEQTFRINYALENVEGSAIIPFPINTLELLPGVNITINPVEDEGEEDVEEEPEEIDNNNNDDEEEDSTPAPSIDVADDEPEEEQSEEEQPEEEKPQEKQPAKETSIENSPLKIRVVGNHAEVVGCRRIHTADAIDIPITYQGKPVTKIAPYAFYEIEASSIYAPSIKEIAPRALVNCSSTTAPDDSTMPIYVNENTAVKFFNSSVIYNNKSEGQYAIRKRHYE